MVRSMYSGVSGLRSHQTRMDTIGNNIANVNTYGFKSGRTTFRDIYYQQMNSASEPTAAMGGVNPSAVGYGGKVGSVDLMMGRSTLTMTDQTMDLAIDGDGFFQVQDGAGNIYYTRAGMLNFDAAGNLVDMQGNYVLGINGDPTGKMPGSERIQVALPPVPPTPASVEMAINGVDWTLKASNPTTDGNLNFNFAADPSLTDGAVVAKISTSGIIISMHPDNTYSSLGDLNSAINAAIKAANNGEEHPAGDFTLSVGAGQDPFAGGKTLKAEDICSTNYNIKKGTVTMNDSFFGGITTSGVVGNEFSGDGPMSNLTCQYQAGPPAQFKVRVEVGGVGYVGYIDQSRSTAGRFNLVNENTGNENDYIEMKRPGFGTIVDEWDREIGIPNNPGAKAGGAYTVTAIPTAGTHKFMGVDVVLDGTEATVDDVATKIAAALNAAGSSFKYSASASAGGIITVEAKDVGDGHGSAAPGTMSGFTGSWSTAWADGTPPGTIANGGGGIPIEFVPVASPSNDDATPSKPSESLGLSGAAFPLRGGTTGGPQTIADMTNISIAPNGIITGLDSTGEKITIGRIDIVTFANPAGLNQAGSSNYTESSNSGEPILNQPGTGGAGKLVGGSLELSNADLSREFSDMITTQRGYQANSRIITVSDSMLEELINLKR